MLKQKQKYGKLLLLSLFLTVILLLTSCSSQKVQTVESEIEANQIITVLREYGIKATKEESGENNNKVYNIYVGGSDEEYEAAIQLMDAHCLPQMKPPPIEDSTLVSSNEVEKSRDLRRMKIDIESQLRNFPGVTCVQVTLGKADDKQLTMDPDPASATVLLKYKTQKLGLNPAQIAQMVAGGITGLEADKVFVTLTREPLKPLPDLDSGRNLRRVLLVGGIGIVTILVFLSIVFFMRKRRNEDDGFEDDSDNLLEEGDSGEMDLLDSGEANELEAQS